MKKILVIDDDDFLRMMMARTLQGCGYITEESRDGIDAIAKLQKNHFDMIVTDAVIIPENKMSIAEYVRKNNPYMPVLVVSSKSLGKDDSDFINISKRFGHERLQKPFKKKEFLEAVARLINLHDGFTRAG